MAAAHLIDFESGGFIFIVTRVVFLNFPPRTFDWQPKILWIFGFMGKGAFTLEPEIFPAPASGSF